MSFAVDEVRVLLVKASTIRGPRSPIESNAAFGPVR
jgi:hypothetical protein